MQPPPAQKRIRPSPTPNLAHLSSARSRRPLLPSANRPPTTAAIARSTPRTQTRTGTHTRTGTRTRTRTRTATATARTQTRQEDSFIVAVIDNTVKDVGFCAYNLHGFDVQLRQFADSNTYATLITVLCVFAPVEILLSLSSAGGLLDQAIQACPHLSNVKRTFIGRTYFNETYGALVAENLSCDPCPNLARLGESSCYLSLACCGALIRYVEHVEDLAFSPSSLRIRFQPNDRTVFLDMPTLEGLEVVSNARHKNGLHAPSSSSCLLRVLDNTKTRSGKRFLRRSLLEPCADLVTITMRQEAVEELGNSEETYFAIVSVLTRFPDLERAMAALMARENHRLRAAGMANSKQNDDTNVEESDNEDDEDVVKMNTLLGIRPPEAAPPSLALIQNILVIKSALQSIAPLLEAVENSESSLLRAIAESMRNSALLSLQSEIADIIDSDALPAKDVERMRMNGAFAVKSGRNGRLDTSRKVLSENVEDMQALTDELRKKYGLYKMELCLHAKRGYHFSLPTRFLEMKDFPEEFIQIDEGRKLYRFSSEELGQLNMRYQDSLAQIWRWTEQELASLLNEIFRPKALSAIHRLCDSTAILDCLASFVTYCSLSPIQTAKPKLTERGPVALKDAYHPVLYDHRPQTTVPNDLFLDETSALHFVSGRNQAGKSTYIRAVGLVCIMAHTGCSVPAKYATVRLLRRIVTAFSTGDDISQSQSHFSKEMDDISTIFDSIRENGADVRIKRSRDAELSDDEPVAPANILVLIDELGRSTSTLDGFAIANAVAEELTACPNVLTLFTTHFLGLGAMAKVNPLVKNVHMSTSLVTRSAASQDDSSPEHATKFNYKVTDGVLTESNYGIETARLAGFPREITDEAITLRSEVPIRRIAEASDFSENHLKLSQTEQLQVRKTSGVVSIAQRLSVISVSNTEADGRQKLYQNLRNKIRQRSAGEAGAAADGGQA